MNFRERVGHTAPLTWENTSPNGTLCKGMYTLTYTMAGFSAGVTPYADLRAVSNEPVPASVCSALGRTG
ncbi:hypothetical protein ACL90Y_06485 [Micrococcus luteus]